MNEVDLINEYEDHALSPGQLGINAHVIHDTRGNVVHQRFIGHEVVPTLFLPDMREHEAARRERQAMEFTAVSEMLFLQKPQDVAFSAEAVRASLFVERPLEQVRVLGDTPTSTVTPPIPGWAIGIFIVMGLAILAGVSVRIGQQWAKRRRKV